MWTQAVGAQAEPGIDRTTVVSVVDGLDERGLVDRRRSPDDRRAYLLT